ncbi:DNA-binding protein [Desulfonema limicola]|uniref:DNA-binding protein n=1 Tax=Desulfonema limicola TaxID=45656 RepID=A0A975B686_9BACT|nr:HU family DNA-binding protein [Desulfonema limicola]QTA79522.1 DNA-binding protein [Desulfonema limicola]
MKKDDIINELAKVLNSKKDAKTALESLITCITEALKRGEKVTLTGFGTFDVNDRKARKGRNPQTGEPIDIKASRVPRFAAGKTLKNALN